MWVISRGIYLGVLVFSFISVLLFQRSGHFYLFWPFRVCVCSFCFYFPDVFSSTMSSDLQATVPQGSSALQSLASSLPDVALASRAPSTSSKYFSSYIRRRSWAWEHGLTVFPRFSVSLSYLSASLNDWGKDSISPGVSSSQHCLVSPAAISFWSSVGEEYSCWCAAFAGPSNNQEGAFHSLSVRAVSCFQGGLNGLFV